MSDRDRINTHLTATSCLGPEEGWAGSLVLVAGHAGRTGGMETFCRFLAEAAVAANWRVAVALSGENIYERLQASHPLQIDVDPVNWIDRTCAGDREYHWGRIRERRRWFRRIRPNVAIVVQSSNTPFRCAIVGARLAGVPVIATHRTMAYPVEDVPSRRHCFGLLHGIGLHRRRVITKTWLTAMLANRIVYNSAAVRKEYEELYHYPRGRGVVIPNAVPVGSLPARSASEGSNDQAPRSRFGMVNAGTTPVTIGFAGRIGSDKRLDVLLRAVAAMNDRLRLRVILYGEGADQPALAALAEELGMTDRVEWRGVAQNPVSAYADMDIVVLCSRRESSSNMVLEAMAAGKAVVVTEAGGMPELVGNGECGICVPALNVPALTVALEWLATHEPFRRQLGERAQEKALRDHAPTAVADAWLTVLNEVAGRHAKRMAPGSQSPALTRRPLRASPRGLKPAAL